MSAGAAFPAAPFSEGTWTPVLTCGTPGNLAVTYSTQVGTWHRVGRLVHVTFSVVTSAFTHTTASGNLAITGLPVACQAATNHIHLGGTQWSGITKANFTHIEARVVQGASEVSFACMGSAQAAATLAITDLPTGGSVVLRGTAIYPAA